MSNSVGEHEIVEGESMDETIISDQDSQDLSPTEVMDSVKFITKYLNSHDTMIITDKYERERQIHEWITLYHNTSLPMDERLKYRDCVIHNVFYLFPYVLSRRRLRFSLFDEAIQQLVIGTIQAIEKYDYNNYNRFIAYLSKYITESISICMQEDTIISIPSSARKKIIKTLRKQEESGNEEDNSVMQVGTDFDSDSDSGTPINTPNAMGCFYRGEEYLEEVGYSTTEEGIHSDVHNSVETNEYLKILEFALSDDSDVLTDKERFVITYRFGIFGAPKLTLKQVADMFHSQGWKGTIEWIFQLEKRATEKLYKFMRKCGLTEGLAV